MTASIVAGALPARRLLTKMNLGIVVEESIRISWRSPSQAGMYGSCTSLYGPPSARIPACSENRIRTDPMLITVFRCEWEALSRLLFTTFHQDGRIAADDGDRPSHPSADSVCGSVGSDLQCGLKLCARLGRLVPGVAMMQAAQPRRQHLRIRAWPLLHHPPVRRVLR